MRSDVYSTENLREERQIADSSVRKSAFPPRILVVEDQDDVRRMLATALEIEGYVVDEASTAAKGLSRLSQSQYELVVSDYAMPGATGTWMLAEADRRGLMGRTVSMIVTAHPDVDDVVDYAVLSKPVDLDIFFEMVRSLIECGPPVESIPSYRAVPANTAAIEASAPDSSVRSRAKQNLR